MEHHFLFKDPNRRVIRFSINKDIVEITTWLVKKNGEETIYTLSACVSMTERAMVSIDTARAEWHSFIENGFAPISTEEIKAGVCRWVENVRYGAGKYSEEMKQHFPDIIMREIEKFETSYKSQLTHNTQYALEA